MSESTHTYRAYLIADPEDVLLPVRGGSITLDAGSAPHVTASLEVSAPGVWEFVLVGYPDEAGYGYGEGEYGAGGYGGWGTETEWTPDELALDALDPRLNARVRVEVDAVGSFGTISRSFDLGVRERNIDHRGAVVSLTLASDEALLIDYAPLEDDDTPRSLESSLRDVIDYVIDTAIPGAALESSPAIDADVTAYWSVSNLIPDAGFEVTTDFWGDGTNAIGFAATPLEAHSGAQSGHWGTGAAGVSYATSGAVSVTPGETYIFSGYARASVARNARLLVKFHNAAEFDLEWSYNAPTMLSTSSWTRLEHMRTAPPGATQATLHVEYDASAAAQFVFIDDMMFYEGGEVVPDFTGSTPADDDYYYEWSDDAYSSTATRIPFVDRPREALTWRAGQPAMEFLAPLIQSSGYRLVCDEHREWTLRDEYFEADGSVSIRHALNMTTANERISRDAGIWFDAAVARYTWTDDKGMEQTRTDAYALSDPYTRLQLFEFPTPYPGPGFAEYAVRRAQERGREIDAGAVSQWQMQAEQNVTIYMDDTPTQVGKSQRVVFDLDSDEMTVSARTQDTPEGSIDTLLGTIDSLVGTINGL